MFPGGTYYGELQFQPEQGSTPLDWCVWCVTGALKVLNENFPKLAQGETFRIMFGNNSAAYTRPGQPLWERMRELAATYTVEVYELRLSCPKYIAWTGDEYDLGAFDVIRITNK